MSDSEPGQRGPTHKTCPDCGEMKPLDDFPVAARGRFGRQTYCRPCMNKRSLESLYRKRAREGRPIRPRRIVETGHRWCPDCETVQPLSSFPKNRRDASGFGRYCKPCHNTRTRETRDRLYGGSREYHLRRRYGIGQADVDRMLAAQGGLCAMCGKADPEHVDHDHETGRVRGLLCFNCTRPLAMFATTCWSSTASRRI